MKPHGLTLYQAKILLDITEATCEQGGNFPTFREIREICGFASTNTVWYYVNLLCEKGYILKIDKDGKQTQYRINHMRATLPRWYYTVRSEYIDKIRERLDVNWEEEI